MSLSDKTAASESATPDGFVKLEKASSHATEDEHGPVPDGGMRAWLVAVGAATGFFCTTGYNSTFGVFQAYYMFNQLQDHSSDAIAWIGSVQAFFTIGSGIIVGPLFDRYGGWIMRPAALVFIFSIMMTSLCKEYWQFMLAQGVLSGVSAGVVACCTMVPIGQWFDKKRGAAMGLAISGSSIGAVILPIVLSNLLTATDIGFGWTVRIVGFVMMPFLAFASFAIKSRLPPRKTTFFVWYMLKNPMYDLLVAGFFFAMIGYMVPMFLLPTYAITKGVDETLAGYLLAILNGASFFGRVIPGVLGDKVGRLNVFAVATLSSGILVLCWPLAETTSVIIGMAVLFGFFGGSIMSGASVSLLECTDNPKNLGSYIGVAMSIVSVSTFIGPPVSGALFDKYHSFDQLSWFCGTLTIVGAVFITIAKAKSRVGLFGKI